MQRALIRFHQWEIAACLVLGRLQRVQPSHAVFIAASRLGDGILWYALWIALLLVQGISAIPALLHMAVVGLGGTALYAAIKHGTQRLRPYEAEPRVALGTRALDRYSFPSGHTLHAVSFTILATTYYPALTGWLIPVAMLIAASRVVLGLHYPTDVAAGAAIGALLTWGSFALPFFVGAL